MSMRSPRDKSRLTTDLQPDKPRQCCWVCSCKSSTSGVKAGKLTPRCSVHSCGEVSQFIWGHGEVFLCEQVDHSRPRLLLSDELVRAGTLLSVVPKAESKTHFFFFDWIRGLCWSLPPNSSIPSLPLCPGANFIIFSLLLLHFNTLSLPQRIFSFSVPPPLPLPCFLPL